MATRFTMADLNDELDKVQKLVAKLDAGRMLRAGARQQAEWALRQVAERMLRRAENPVLEGK